MTDSSESAAREAALVGDLCNPANLIDGAAPTQSVRVERTHGSVVFLVGDDVFKLKRAVDFGFFDFTTLDARRIDCEAELRLNRRTAPDVYRGMLPVYRDADGYSLTRRAGEVSDYVVHMQRLPDHARASDLLERDELTPERLDELALYVAKFYRDATKHAPAAAEMRGNIEENFAQTRASGFVGEFIEAEALEQLERAQLAWLDRVADLLATRPSRDGHGDLRLEHVYFLSAGPIAIDCIEFADRFRIADPALDVAFFAMELYREGRADLAETFLAGFAYAADDYDLYALIDGYMSYRAVVRAKVAGFVAIDAATDATRRERKTAEARAHFELAARLIEEDARAVAVVAVGGLPASGKSTVARHLRPRLRGPIVSADATRKHLAGVARDDSAGPEFYRPEFSEQVIDEVERRAGRVLESGRPVILDSTFRARATRARAADLAHRHDVPLWFIECVAPESVLRERIRSRRGDVSDADEAVLDQFLSQWEAVTEVEPGAHAVFHTDRPFDLQLARVVKQLIARGVRDQRSRD